MSKHSAQRALRRVKLPLNALAFGVAISGILLPVYMQSPARLAEEMQSMLGAAGATMSANVPVNPINTMAQQLSDEKKSLDEREAVLAARENHRPITTGEIFGFISFALSVVLCMLVGLNFYMDSRRGKKGGLIVGKYQVDLS